MFGRLWNLGSFRFTFFFDIPLQSDTIARRSAVEIVLGYRLDSLNLWLLFYIFLAFEILTVSRGMNVPIVAENT